MKKIGIYGGTFNPPHTGHLHAAKQAVQKLDLDLLLMIPDRIAPHKQIPAGSPTPAQRLEMLRIALAGAWKWSKASWIPWPSASLWAGAAALPGQPPSL